MKPLQKTFAFGATTVLLLLGGPAIGTQLAPSDWLATAALADDGGEGDGGEGGGGIGGGGGSGSVGPGVIGFENRTRARTNIRSNRRARRSKRARRNRQPQFADGRENREIIAINLSAITTQRLRRSGWRVRSRRVFRNIGLEVARIELSDPANRTSALATLRQRFPTEAFSVNDLYVPAAASCGDQRCYGQKLIEWTDDTGKCGQGIRVGIVDTAVNRKAPVLRGRKIHTHRFTARVERSSSTHGTTVASLLVGKKGDTFSGLIPQARLYAAEAFYQTPDGQSVANATSIAAALDWLVGRRVSHINLSLSGPHNPLLEAAISGAASADVVLIAAAGNGGPDAPPSYPAAYDQVVAATAIDADLRPYRQANRGDYIDIAAPGVRIWTPEKGAEGRYDSGTSFAAAFATAVLSQKRITVEDSGKLDSAPSSAELLRDIGPEGHDDIFGHGLIKLHGGC